MRQPTTVKGSSMKSKSQSLVILISSMFLLTGARPARAQGGTWMVTGAMTTNRASHTAALLADGQVLAAGGANSSGTLSSAELYDPATGTWATTSALNNARREATATLLPKGK